MLADSNQKRVMTGPDQTSSFVTVSLICHALIDDPDILENIVIVQNIIRPQMELGQSDDIDNLSDRNHYMGI